MNFFTRNINLPSALSRNTLNFMRIVVLLQVTRTNTFTAGSNITNLFVLDQRVKVNPLYYNNLNIDFRINEPSRLLNTTRYKSNTFTKSAVVSGGNESISTWRLFEVFISVNASTGLRLFKTHPSFFFFFIRHKKGGVSALDVSRLFTRWRDMYLLMLNLTYYEVEFLSFGTRFFKEEVLALNWKNSNQWKFMWKFIRPFLFLQPNKITNQGDQVFWQLYLTGLRVSVILDTPYHLKTLYYLHRAGFYSIGPVPLNYDKNLVDYAVPVGVDSLFTHMFFLRLLLQLRRGVSAESYRNLKKLYKSI